MGGSEYANSVSMDEFSGGMEFDAPVINSQMVCNDDYDDDNESSASGDNGRFGHNGSDICLENDIWSNLDILLTLFTGDQINTQPLAAPIYDVDASMEGVGNQLTYATKSASSNSQFGVGLIML